MAPLLGTRLYNMVFRRTSTLFVAILVGAVVFERVYEPNTDILWERLNKGVSIKHDSWDCMLLALD